jgi:predicted P-loop ATPase
MATDTDPADVVCAHCGGNDGELREYQSQSGRRYTLHPQCRDDYVASRNARAAEAAKATKAPAAEPSLQAAAEPQTQQPEATPANVVPMADHEDKRGLKKQKPNGGAGADTGRSSTAPKPPAWLSKCQTDAWGNVICNLDNALRALTEDEQLKDMFAFNEMSRRVMVVKPLNDHDRANPEFAERRLTDTDCALVMAYLQQNGLLKIGPEAVNRAIDIRAERQKFHPVREYLDRLAWDGTERLGTWMATCLGADYNDYNATIGTMMIIAMTARIYRPGCKFDHMVILEGPQGAMKSTALSVLGGPYFSDALPDIATGGKDVSQHLRGKWLIEVTELHAMSRAGNSLLKSFLSRDKEQYRPSYGRNDVDEPRQCIFVGTTNREQYLRDETGARRFWPVKIGTINLNRLREQRDQMFAEAVNRFKNGEQWWPSRQFEQAHLHIEQDERYEVDAWEQAIVSHLDASTATDVTVFEIARGCLEFDNLSRIGTADQRRIIAILEHLGWKRGKRYNNRRPWLRPK